VFSPWFVKQAFCCALVCLPTSPGGAVAAESETLANAIQGKSDIRVVEGDILQWRGTNRRSLALRGNAPTWRDGIVPYRIDSTLGESSVAAIEQAIDMWNQISGISLKPIDEVLASDPTLSPVHLDSIRFQPGEGCASWVGRRGSEQEIWVAPSCTAGSMMHEIGHVLGLEHEHTRPDRDQYITIHWGNITEEKRHNFDIAGSRARQYGEYDYGSIMHYGPNNFAIGSDSTITPIYAPESAIGQRLKPSEGDLAAVAELYGTDLSVITQFYELLDGAESSILVSNNLNQGAHNIEVDVSQDFSQLVAYSDNGWTCRARESGIITCYLDRLAAATHSVLILGFKADTVPADVRAEVRSKTPDASEGNNSDISDVTTALAAAQSRSARLQDDAQSLTLTGSANPAWLLLVLLWIQRKTCCRVHRQA